MRITITGANGYIGRVVTTELLDYFRYAEFLLLDRSFVGGIPIEEIKGIEGDWLIHLAADISVPESESNQLEYWKNNCMSYQQFLQNNQFKNIIYASSAAVYDENGCINPQNVYGVTKLYGEALTKRNKGNSYILRFANPVGVEKYHQGIVPKILSGCPNVFWKLANHIVSEKQEPFLIHRSRREDIVRDFFPVDWIAKSCLNIMKHSSYPTGVYDIGSGKEASVYITLRYICEQYGIKWDEVENPLNNSNGFVSKETLYLEEKSGYNSFEFCKTEFPKYIRALKEAINAK